MARSRRFGKATERGASTVVVVLGMSALLGGVALAIDVGLTWSARTQLQGAADASALAAALNMIDTTATPVAVTTSAGTTEAISVGAANSALPVSSVVVNPGDIQFGDWDLSTRVFDSSVDLSDPDNVTAAQVTARLEAGTNQPVPAFFSRVLGQSDFPVLTTAIAYRGFAGSVGPGEVDLPIAIDCCAISGSACAANYCDEIAANPPNPCPLETGNAGSGTVTCLEFNSTPEQNACWTQFDDQSPSINTPTLSDIVEDGNPETVSTNDSVFLDNGDKTPVIDDINDRFNGTGNFGEADGIDFYEPKNGNVDSWVVGLPVVACQTDDHCAGPETADIVGFVCFEIMEIEVTPGKLIRGKFLCPGDPRYDDCELGATGSGGQNFGIRATIPSLVQ